MKLQIEDYLYSLDQTLSQKSDRDKNMLFIMIFATCFAFSYLLFWEDSEASFTASHEKAVKVENDLTVDKDYLNAFPPERISQIEQETVEIEKQNTQYVHYNTYIKEQLEQISSLYYDEKVWGAYLDSISRYARANNIKLIRFGNTLQTDNSSFGHVLDITISAQGPYKNTLKFINSLEQSQLVVDLHDFNLTAEEKMHADLNISVWGIVRQ
ncbi:MAG: type 4a pilus biogenesis protein PilO [Sulfuricurvum sp.]|nr:type 4a pilus biogenesis protein PilO [Sulfuricurvum sp.]